MERFFLTLPVILCLIMLALLNGCGDDQAVNTVSSPAGTPISTTVAVQEYADPATESILQGFSENNYDKYTHYCNSQMKAAMTREAFEKTSTQIQQKFGNYRSKTFLSTEKKDNYVIAHYEAQYTKGTFKVRMVFDQNQQIAGQWFE